MLRWSRTASRQTTMGVVSGSSRFWRAVDRSVVSSSRSDCCCEVITTEFMRRCPPKANVTCSNRVGCESATNAIMDVAKISGFVTKIVLLVVVYAAEWLGDARSAPSECSDTGIDCSSSILGFDIECAEIAKWCTCSPSRRSGDVAKTGRHLMSAGAARSARHFSCLRGPCLRHTPTNAGADQFHKIRASS